MFLPISCFGVTVLLVSLAVTERAQSFSFEPCSESDLQIIVGSVQGKCCQPGRRWGCDPENFGQTGCTPILGPVPRCVSREWMTMKCTSARCVRTNPEHECEVDIRSVSQNRCRPTGRRTTVGCPEEHWRCEVLKKDYTHHNSPTVDVLVCDFEISTPCAAKYSHCD